MNTLNKLNTHKLFAILISVIGLLLLIFMILVEDEPGAIPLLLIFVGLGWYFRTRARIKSKHS